VLKLRKRRRLSSVKLNLRKAKPPKKSSRTKKLLCRSGKMLEMSKNSKKMRMIPKSQILRR
jgi:hypothetical protein